MKKYLFNTFLAGLGFMLILVACKKNNEVVDQDPLAVPPYAKFNTLTSGDTLATFYVRSTSNYFKLPIGVTNISDKDRTINFTYSSNTAVQGVNYNAPTTLVIKAGQALDTLRIQGLYPALLTSTQQDTITIRITGGDGIVPINYAGPRKDTYRLVLRKYCDVNINAFLGDYTRSKDRQGTGAYTSNYTTKITSIVSTGPTSATAIIYNFGDPMFGAPYNPGDLAITPGITVNLDWSNDANFKVTMPATPQQLSVSYYGTTGVLKAGTTIGTFSSCDNTFTIVYNFTLGATNYGNFTTVLAR